MTRTKVRGFTLFEVLLALALVALLAGAMFALISELGSQRRQIGDAWRRWRATDVLFDALERDLACVIAGDARVGAGIKGNQNSLALLTRGVWIDPDAPSDAAAAARSRDLTRVAYQTGESGGIRCRRAVVLRAPNAGSPPPERNGTIGADLRSVRFRYFDGREWQDAFDSLQKGHLPEALEIAVWLGGSSPSTAGSGASSPSPDRLRVIVIPDARGNGRSGG